MFYFNYDNNHVVIPNTLFVGSLPIETEEYTLIEFFNIFGQVENAKIIYDSNGISKCYGFVKFKCFESIKKVFKMGQLFINGKNIMIGNAYKKININNCYSNNNYDNDYYY